MPRNRQKKPLSAKQQFMNNTPKLIALMESKPLLWDTTDPNFYNLPERFENWRDMTRQMFSNYDECDEEDQKQMVMQIKTRWRHVRTAYVRQKKVPNLKKSCYVYDKEMAFYSSHGRCPDGSLSGEPNGEKGENCNRKSKKKVEYEVELIDTELEHNASFKRRRLDRKSKVKAATKKGNSPSQDTSIDEVYNEILIQEFDENNTEEDTYSSYIYEYDDEADTNLHNATEDIKLETFPPMEQNVEMIDENNVEDEQQNTHPMVQIPNDAHEREEDMEPVKASSSNRITPAGMKNCRNLKMEEIDDDQCFFDSLKPALRDLNEDDKMDFRIEVMSILRDLKRK